MDQSLSESEEETTLKSGGTILVLGAALVILAGVAWRA